jgi:hypothetical protein
MHFAFRIEQIKTIVVGHSEVTACKARLQLSQKPGDANSRNNYDEFFVAPLERRAQGR